MTQSTDDNRPTPPAAADHTGTGPVNTAPIDTRSLDPLDEIAADLEGLADLDPADAVPVLAEITTELNKELDADTDRS